MYNPPLPPPPTHTKKPWTLFLLFFLLPLSLFYLYISRGGTIPSLTTAISTPSSVSVATLAGSIQGKPTISASHIDTILCNHGSPACHDGKKIVALGEKYGIDPVYALAFYLHESGFGTTGEARVTHSWGNQRCLDSTYDFLGTWCVDGNYAAFPTVVQGAEAWFRCIRVLYIERWKLTTIATIIPAYAPKSDGNDVKAYIAAINTAVTLWRSGSVSLP